MEYMFSRLRETYLVISHNLAVFWNLGLQTTSRSFSPLIALIPGHSMIHKDSDSDGMNLPGNQPSATGDDQLNPDAMSHIAPQYSPMQIEGASLSQAEAVLFGGFSDVFHATMQGKQVALKRLRVFQNQDKQKVYQRTIKEAQVWRRLEHPHILPFLGIETKIFSPLICLVSPWMCHGTLMDFISNRALPKTAIDILLYEVAQGLTYLHLEKVVHGDVRGANILIDEKEHARLADFGLSAIIDATPARSTSAVQGSPRWMAPELLDPEASDTLLRRTYATDVYAFACTCVEAYRGQPPFPGVTNNYTVIIQVIGGARPKQPCGETGVAMSDDLWELVEHCLTRKPDGRPSMSVVVGAMPDRI